MFKRNVFIPIAIACAAFALSGCSGSSSDESPTETTLETTMETTTAVPTTAETIPETETSGMVIGWNQDEDGNWFFTEIVTGWYQDNNSNWYYLDPEDGGARVSGWKDIDGERYYFANNGIMTTGWFATEATDGTYVHYYLNESGYMVTGWEQIDGSWYYFGDDGRMYTGLQVINGQTYYLYPEENADVQVGTMMTGDVEINGTMRHFDSSGAEIVETSSAQESESQS